MRKRQRRIVWAAAGLMAVSGIGAFAWLAPRKTVEVEVTGTPGLAVEGECEFDGKATELSGTVPFSARYRGVRDLSFAVRPRGSGDLTVTMHVEGRPSASATAGAGQGVRGRVHSGRLGGLFDPDYYGISTFSPEP
ncbi:MAG TPA: hypothetical protein VF170_07730 [Planctomycetaceae bacterium]